MKPLYRGIAVAVLQSLIVLVAFGKYALDRELLPRVWAKAAPVDPNLPLRGRYLSMYLEVDLPSELTQTYGSGRLIVRDGRLFVQPDNAPFDSSSHVHIVRMTGAWVLTPPVAFFVPEHAAESWRPPAGKAYWVEVSVPPKGPPRPIRMEVR
ncbi:MAG TPA: hypothetical protein VHW09_12260 [Bryobacteraceae bacterium]|nr:hypothetical protein [Bryobacteraceae bacterium]